MYASKRYFIEKQDVAGVIKLSSGFYTLHMEELSHCLAEVVHTNKYGHTFINFIPFIMIIC